MLIVKINVARPHPRSRQGRRSMRSGRRHGHQSSHIDPHRTLPMLFIALIFAGLDRMRAALGLSLPIARVAPAASAARLVTPPDRARFRPPPVDRRFIPVIGNAKTGLELFGRTKRDVRRRLTLVAMIEESAPRQSNVMRDYFRSTR